MEYPNESMTLPTEVLKKYVSPLFVETGSYDGRTIQQALDVGFARVISVEIDPIYASICRQRFQEDHRVQVWEGDSLDLLWDMIKDLNEPITYWLDAHCQEDHYGKIKAPLLYELDIISNQPLLQESIIMIDDRRLFGHIDSPNVWQPITEEIVVNKLCMIMHNSLIVYEDSKAAKNDILVCKAMINIDKTESEVMYAMG